MMIRRFSEKGVFKCELNDAQRRWRRGKGDENEKGKFCSDV